MPSRREINKNPSLGLTIPPKFRVFSCNIRRDGEKKKKKTKKITLYWLAIIHSKFEGQGVEISVT